MEAPTELAGMGHARRYPPRKLWRWAGTVASGISRRSSRARPWVHTRLTPVNTRYVLVRDPKGKLHMETFIWNDLQTTPEQILTWVVMLRSLGKPFEEGLVYLGWETQRMWSDQAITRITQST
jgi:hypothetical protein